MGLPTTSSQGSPTPGGATKYAATTGPTAIELHGWSATGSTRRRRRPGHREPQRRLPPLRARLRRRALVPGLLCREEHPARMGRDARRTARWRGPDRTRLVRAGRHHPPPQTILPSAGGASSGSLRSVDHPPSWPGRSARMPPVRHGRRLGSNHLQRDPDPSTPGSSSTAPRSSPRSAGCRPRPRRPTPVCR
jgi:hypothetical protein